MICVSIQEDNLQKCKEILSNCQMAEIRADLCKFSTPDIEQLVSSHPNILITCRIAGSSREFAYEQITGAIIKGARYVDVELEAPDTHLEYIKSYARANSCKLIISYHNFEGTNSLEELIEIYNLCLRKGADIVKIVTTAHTISDAVRTLSLYKTEEYLTHRQVDGKSSETFCSSNNKASDSGNHTPHNTNEHGTLVAFSMGEAGKFTRHLCLAMGAPYTYACYDTAGATAPGQYTKEELENILNPKQAFSTASVSPALLPCALTIPCSKSVAQRAILAAAIAQGTTKNNTPNHPHNLSQSPAHNLPAATTLLHNYAPCNDITGAISLIRNLGCRVTIHNTTLTINGALQDNLSELDILHVGESGLLTRLAAPFAAFLSQVSGKEITISGHGSILKRNLEETVKALQIAGATCKSNKGHLPFHINGPISNSAIEFSGKESSQIVSGFLITLPLLKYNSTLTITNPTSIPYIQLTLKTLEQFGIKIDTNNTHPDKIIYHIPGNQIYTPTEIYLDSDWSSAAYFAVAGAIAGEITLLNMPQQSAQADEAILEILQQCGAEITIKAAQEERGLWDITIKATPLHSFTYNATHCPDLFPILATLAAHCSGTSCIKGVSRLLQKESNRAETIFTEFTKLGADINISDDSMYIRGGKLHGANVTSHNDHRIAMSLIIAGLFTKEPVTLDNIKCIDKSFPSFTERLAGKIR
ncbi:MAG: 3-phosphoshikimate 1-carboxyvinyltransferase [Bacteroidales bacterium]